MNNPLGLALVKGNREPHEARKKYFDLGGNRTYGLRIRSTVTLLTDREYIYYIKPDIPWRVLIEYEKNS